MVAILLKMDNTYFIIIMNNYSHRNRLRGYQPTTTVILQIFWTRKQVATSLFYDSSFKGKWDEFSTLYLIILCVQT